MSIQISRDDNYRRKIHNTRDTLGSFLLDTHLLLLLTHTPCASKSTAVFVRINNWRKFFFNVVTVTLIQRWNRHKAHFEIAKLRKRSHRYKCIYRIRWQRQQWNGKNKKCQSWKKMSIIFMIFFLTPNFACLLFSPNLASQASIIQLKDATILCLLNCGYHRNFRWNFVYLGCHIIRYDGDLFGMKWRWHIYLLQVSAIILFSFIQRKENWDRK